MQPAAKNQRTASAPIAPGRRIWKSVFLENIAAIFQCGYQCGHHSPMSALHSRMRLNTCVIVAYAMLRLIQLLIDSIVRLSPGGAQAFFESASFPWVARLEENWQSIRSELDAVMKKRESIPGLEDISQGANLGPDNQPLSHGDEWQWFLLYGFGHRIQSN